MVIADEVQRAVDDQVRRMVFDADPLLPGLARAGLARQTAVAEQYFAVVAVVEAFEQVGMPLRKGQHIGRLVKIGRAYCRERVFQYVSSPLGAVTLKK